MIEVVVERSFSESMPFERLAAMEALVEGCLSRNRVSARDSFRSHDGRYFVCRYDAPDAESVRITQDEGGLPYDAIWSGRALPMTARQIPPGYGLVIVQRELPVAVPIEEVAVMMERGDHCAQLHRALPLGSTFALDGRRMLCRYAAPDAESVRTANRQAELPFARAWSATQIVAQAK